VSKQTRLRFHDTDYSTDSSVDGRADVHPARSGHDGRRRRHERATSPRELDSRGGGEKNGHAKSRRDYSAQGRQRRPADGTRSKKKISKEGQKADEVKFASTQRGRTRTRVGPDRKRYDSSTNRRRRNRNVTTDSDSSDGTECVDSPDSSRSRGRRFKGAGKADPDPDDDACDNRANFTHRRPAPTLKLGSYDGSTCLETFLAKYQNCAEYYGWNKNDKLCHLRATLEGRAGNVLWEAKPHTTASELIALLKNRFGSQDQKERYRIELKTQKKEKE